MICHPPSLASARRLRIAAALTFAVTIGNGVAGCSSGVQPAIAMPRVDLVLTTQVSPTGVIAPSATTKSVTISQAPSVLWVELQDYAGFSWVRGTSSDDATLSVIQDGSPPICPPATATATSTSASSCGSIQQVQYTANTSGTATIVFTLVAGAPAPAPAASSEISPQTGPETVPTVPVESSATRGAPACPAGITAPPPPARRGCVLGSVTVTVTIG